MKFTHYILFTLMAAGSFGCKKYLSEEPRKQASIQTTDQLDALIDNYSIFAVNGSSSAMFFSTDDMDLKTDAYKASPTLWSLEVLCQYTFDATQLPTITSDAFWTSEYKKIFTANVVLFNVDDVTGSEEAKNQLKADAHFIRALSYWQLANHYCLPYSEANAAAPGLPLKQSVSYAESLVRATLKETYDFIEKELEAAKLTTQTDVNNIKPWRVSQTAVAGMQSRFYLFKGDYAKALQYANDALQTKNANLVDFRTIVAGNAVTYPSPAPAVTLKYSEINYWTAIKWLYWKEFLYARVAYNANQSAFPSDNLLSLYDTTNDLRFKWFMIPNSNRRFAITAPAFYRYCFFEDGRYFPIGPTVSEMLLNKAEVLARTGNVQEAMNAVNALRSKRFAVDSLLSANDKSDALKKVLQERRREMPFAMRWYDIRRFSVNEDPSDDVTVQHSFFKMNNGLVDQTATQSYQLTPGSKRYAVPINQLEITNSQNQIIQNQY
ncbi:RagB/SusD family nutrient uptake outer membrane protein [Pinibacter aurantiacus]|uniref:RagB/SusD family nutrient uptake outer membrane protein n=1 Tax=Pinibacter aurantiacus TaxID=2851599 RepID=A0A9E2SC83_9BACT|nr:RagB/SusD family nutrient uptake outer membrane protein [Pinibacter aurantiacus]MBV4358839.1 RagB/SusD family nutrient uptake outer membrane protein [Pinibacter aurantiacus]